MVNTLMLFGTKHKISFADSAVYNVAMLAGHYCDVIMGAMAFQITSLTIVYLTVYSEADQRKHKSSASLAFVLYFDISATGLTYILGSTHGNGNAFLIIGLCEWNALVIGGLPWQFMMNLVLFTSLEISLEMMTLPQSTMNLVSNSSNSTWIVNAKLQCFLCYKPE